MFTSLEFRNWRQYEEISINFHNQLTVITGANGSGKTTILTLLGRHFNWHTNYVTGFKRTSNAKTGRLLLDIIQGKNPVTPSNPQMPTEHIGHFVYSNGATSTIQIPTQAASQYGIMLNNQQVVPGIYIPSHRPTYSYQPVVSIPTQAITQLDAYNLYQQATYQRFVGQNPQKSPVVLIKEALISFAVFGYGNERVTPDANASSAFEGFENILSKILPAKIGFERISIQVPEVILETKSGNFPIDSVSGGVASIIDIAWQIFMYSPQGTRFVCTIDEPENHLHPELQQSLLANLISAFPNVMFVVATHSPFIITSVYDSSVYVLDYNEKNRVESTLLETVNKSGTANETLKNVLGLPFTMPLWAGKKFDDIIQKYTQIGVSDVNVEQLEGELKAAGLEDFVPERGALE